MRQRCGHMREVRDLDSILCPITHEIFHDPVMTCDGMTYERNAIMTWFEEGNRSSPMTGMTLPILTLIPNLTLKKLIHEYNSTPSSIPSSPSSSSTSQPPSSQRIRKKRKWIEQQLLFLENENQQFLKLSENYSHLLSLKRIQLEILEEEIQKISIQRMFLRSHSSSLEEDTGHHEQSQGPSSRPAGPALGPEPALGPGLGPVSERGNENEEELRALKRSSKTLKRQKRLLLEGIEKDLSERTQCSDRLVELLEEKSSLEMKMKKFLEPKRSQESGERN